MISTPFCQWCSSSLRAINVTQFFIRPAAIRAPAPRFVVIDVPGAQIGVDRHPVPSTVTPSW